MIVSSFDMHVNSEPFQKIKNGTKTIELRLYDEKRRHLSITSNYLYLYNRENERELVCADVKDLHIFPTFKELFENKELFDKCGFDGLSPDEAVQVMYRYYSPEDEKKYGVIGIELCKVVYRK